LSEEESNNRQPTQGWNTYWEGVSGSQEFASGGVSHPGFAVFWADALGEFFAARPESRTLDIATGSGTVIERLSLVPGISLESVTCVDIAQAAVDGVKSRFPDVSGVVADANLIPLEPGQFDLITSQFGIEYAGPGAIDEAVRLLAPGGYLIFLMHLHSGALHRNCLATIDALSRVQQANFFELAKTFFEAGFAAVRGADRTPYDRAAKQMNPVIQELESILSQHGENAADGTVYYLYNTLQNIHKRIQYYEPDEVSDWLETADLEISKHLERMRSMNNSALNKAEIEAIRTILINKGLTPSQAEPLLFEGDPLPFAWALQATNA
jgi:ubiquinone/menaquinone biosynthesis C-methylase UbiE